jgi:hypothetical protein
MLIFRDVMPWLSEDEQDTSGKSLYGLRVQYLKSIGITPPLDRWIHVSNVSIKLGED